MRSVLGIDAAWTYKNPSGVALVQETLDGWRLVKVCCCYDDFLRRTPGNFSTIAPASDEILDECNDLLGRPVDLVAIDMPLSHLPIKGRRSSDDKVSAQYGSRKCGTHSPSGSVPGPISDAFVHGFMSSGYPLRTALPVQGGLIEVYPHPALVELTNASERLKYKCGNVSKYWPARTPLERWQLLREEWRLIVRFLDGLFYGTVSAKLPQLREEMTTRERKAFEDALDAVVCAWVGVCVLTGTAAAYGDDDSAIWIPAAGVRTSRG